MRDQVFISYSHKNKEWLERLQTMLKPLIRNNSISVLDDSKIKAGANWREQISKALESAQVAVLLVSPDFLASDFIADHELPPLLKAAEQEGLTILWVYLSACLYKESEIEAYQAAHDVSRPLDSVIPAEQNTILVNICHEIKKSCGKPLLASPLTFGTQQERPWNVPYSRNPFFTGRAKILEQIRNGLQSHGRIALTGLGGIGKTQTAVEYAYLHRNAYDSVLWTGADSREALISGFVGIARTLALAEQNSPDQNVVVSAVRRWCENNKSWLLILDNADDLRLAREFLPSHDEGRVLLTTRAQALGGIAVPVEIDEMEVEEGARFLLQRSRFFPLDTSIDKLSNADYQAAAALVKELGGLPLALDQARAFIEETPSTVSEYLELCKKEGSRLLSERGDLAADHSSVTVTFSLAFKKLAEQSPPAADMIRVCAFLAPDAIPEEIFTGGAAELGELLSPAADPFVFAKTVRDAGRFSLIDRNPKEKTIDIHRLVQVVLRKELTELEGRQWATRALRVVSRVFPTVEFATWRQCERLLAHSQACVTLVDEWNLMLAESAELLIRTGRYLHEHARYAEAENLYSSSLSMREKIFGPKHPDVAVSLNALAVLYDEQGKYDKAEPLYRRALAIREEILGPNHTDVAKSLNNLGVFYNDQAKYAEAEALYRRALAIREEVLGPQHPDVAKSLNNLGVFFRDQGKYAQAEALYRRALAIREEVLGPKHPDVAMSLNNLAALYDDQGKYAEAEQPYQRALLIWEEVLGPKHPDVAMSLNNLAELFRVQRKYAEAESLFLRALLIWEGVFGPKHPDIATSLNNLADLFRVQGKYAEAEPLCQRALLIHEEALGLNHPDVAVTLNNLAELYRMQCKYTEAEPLSQRALAIRESALGSRHPDVAVSLNNLARLYQDEGKYTEAEPLYSRALVISEETLGEKHPHVLSVLNNYATLLKVTDRSQRAEELELRIAAIQLKNPSENI